MNPKEVLDQGHHKTGPLKLLPAREEPGEETLKKLNPLVHPKAFGREQN
jgi:hypothetical protein